MNTAQKLEVNMKAANSQEVRISLLEQSMNHINETLMRIEKRFDRIDDRFTFLEAKLDKKFDDSDKKLDKFDARLWTNFYWILGTVFTLCSVLAGLMAKGFNWFN